MNELMEEANAEAQAYSEEYGVWADATTFLTQEYYDLQDSIYDINDEIWTAQDTIDAYTKAIEEDQEAVAAAERKSRWRRRRCKTLPPPPRTAETPPPRRLPRNRSSRPPSPA